MPPKAKRPLNGIEFPVTGTNGKRSTGDVGKKIFSAAIGSANENDAKKVMKEKNWRYGYSKHVVRHVELSLENSEQALSVARAGLDQAYELFEFVHGSDTMKLSQAVTDIKGSFEIGFIQGDKARNPAPELEIPYKGKTLRGQSLIDQLNKWADYGTIEPSTAKAITECVNNPGWLDLSDKQFVLLGAGSAMGPLLVLLSLGAHVIAIDLDRPQIWQRLIGLVRNSNGSMTFPLRIPQNDNTDDTELFANAGCNLATQAPQIRNWLVELPYKDLVIGSYAYLDSDLHVKVTMGMDIITSGVCQAKPNTILAYLNTPTQVYAIPNEARIVSKNRWNENSIFNLLLTPFRLAGVLKKNAGPEVNVSGTVQGICDGLAIAQGPNYALAKCLQHWRAIVARSQGHIVSSNVAPSTATASVVHNRTFAWAYGGMPNFAPFEVAQQELSNAVMSALLIHDIRNPSSVANPRRELKNPLLLFTENAFHGGVWRCGYKMDTIGGVSVLLYFLAKLKPFLLLLLVAFVAFLLR